MDIQTLEEQIGFAPNKNDVNFVTGAFNAQRAYLRPKLVDWLSLRGIPYKSASTASDASLIKAYAKLDYLIGWRNRVNPAFKTLSADNVDLDALDDVEDTLPKPDFVHGSSPIPQDLSSDEIAERLTTQIAPVIQRLVKIEAASEREILRGDIQRSLKAELAQTKLELSDNAKAQIRDMAREAGRALFAELMPPRTLEIKTSPDLPAVNVGLQHFKFEELLRACSARDHKGNRLNVWLTGPTGSGKTSAAETVAKALNLPFGADSSLDADYKVYGFRNAAGEVTRTTFREIFEHGGIYVADEIDGWHPAAFIALNAPLANGFASFPDGIVRRHPDCIIIACANTWGLGATNEYVGRTKMDAASLDRFFPKIEWPYDDKLEAEISKNMSVRFGEPWCNIVQQTRTRAKTQGLKVIVSPRSSYIGISLLNAGFDTRTVVRQTLGAGLSPEQFKSLGLDQVRLTDAAPAKPAPTIQPTFQGKLLHEVDYKTLSSSRLIEFVEKVVEAGQLDQYQKYPDFAYLTRGLDLESAFS